MTRALDATPIGVLGFAVVLMLASLTISAGLIPNDTMSLWAGAIIAGDGIGPEVIAAGLPIIEAAARVEGLALETEQLPYSADHFLETGETLPDEAFEQLRDEADAILVGALGDPRVPGNEHARDILLGLRFRLDLYINFRPTHLFHPKLSPLRADRRSDGGSTAIDFVIFRENTEGQYLGLGRSESLGTPDEVHVSEEINSRKGVARIIEAAFAWAEAQGKTRVTMSDKSNAIPFQRIWGRLFQEIGERYPAIQREHRYVDALALELVREPERFQVIVTTNLYGDILSDLGAGLIGCEFANDLVGAGYQVAVADPMPQPLGRLLPAEEAGEFGVEYASVVARGRAVEVGDPKEVEHGLRLLMEKYAPHLESGRDYRPITPEEVVRTSVVRMDIDAWSGKQKTEAEDFPGAYWFRDVR